MPFFTDSYHAMNSTFSIRIDFAHADEPLENQVKLLFKRLRLTTETMEQCMSRFRKDSELSFLNAHVGEAIRVSTLMASVLKKTEEAYEWSHGLFDPRVIRVLQSIGYVGILETGDSEQTVDGRRDNPLFIWHDGHVIELNAPIDLGGIGKGYTVDILANLVLQTFSKDELAGFLVNAGGDVLLYGSQENGEPWTVGVENPFSPKEIFAAIRVTEESLAICTSSKWRRKWEYEGREMHHLIDPRTGEPVHSEVMSVTALGTEAAMAEILTKIVFIGDEDWRDEQARYLVIDEKKRLMFTPTLAEQLIWVTPDASSVRPLKAR